MNNTSKESFKWRLIWLTCLLILSIIASGIYTSVYNNNNIVKSDLTICLNDDTVEVFEDQFHNKKNFYKYYDYKNVSDSTKADFTFTSDISMINTSSEYSIVGYSPLVICLKNNENLNNYLKTVTKEGFLTCNSSNKIKNSSSDNITCDFNRIIDAVINGEDWSDLGGEDKKISIYCPSPNTVEGKLFYDFLLITINDGKYPESNFETVKQKADLFLNSENVIQTDVEAKIEKLNGELQEDIYILFEADLISATKKQGDVCITYPETTVVKQLYLQYNNDNLEETITEVFDKSSIEVYSLYSTLRYHYYYRSSSYPALTTDNNYPAYFNVQEGFNYYELTD